MVNLRAAANAATSAINPNISAVASICTGYTSGDHATGYKQVPIYAADAPVIIQAQALTKKEIEHLDSLNISTAERGVYSPIPLTGVDRTTKSGGDLLVFEGSTWLVLAVLEAWPSAGGWCKVAVQRQMDGVT